MDGYQKSLIITLTGLVNARQNEIITVTPWADPEEGTGGLDPASSISQGMSFAMAKLCRTRPGMGFAIAKLFSGSGHEVGWIVKCRSGSLGHSEGGEWIPKIANYYTY